MACPRTVLVGLADTMVSEARDRCRSAVANSGTTWPDQLVTINLAPSTLPKTGSHYDLAIALAVFAAKSLVPAERLAGAAFLGELALDGRLRAIRGVLPATLAAAEAGFERVFVPEVNVPEAELVRGHLRRRRSVAASDGRTADRAPRSQTTRRCRRSMRSRACRGPRPTGWRISTSPTSPVRRTLAWHWSSPRPEVTTCS